jgi:succinate dehydrogenase/fumarate reductase cytochrome b subunit
MSLTSKSVTRRLHRASSLVLVAFIAVHLANHLTALAGIDAHMQFMNAARVVYRATLIEPILLACVLIQLVTGIKQLIAGWETRKRNHWRYAQLVSGVCLMVFLAMHTSAILSIRHWFDLDTNFYAASAVLVIEPLQWFYMPYYWFGVFAVFVHLGCLVRRVPFGSVAIRSALAITSMGFGALVATLIIAAMGGWMFQIDLAPEYRNAVMRYL